MARGSQKLVQFFHEQGLDYTVDEAVAEAIVRLKAAKSRGTSVTEAGRRGGSKVRDERGPEFYSEIGRKGGRKVADLVKAGRRALGDY